MFSCSLGVILKRFPEYAVFGLLGVVVAQGTSALRQLPLLACILAIAALWLLES